MYDVEELKQYDLRKIKRKEGETPCATGVETLITMQISVDSRMLLVTGVVN